MLFPGLSCPRRSCALIQHSPRLLIISEGTAGEPEPVPARAGCWCCWWWGVGEKTHEVPSITVTAKKKVPSVVSASAPRSLRLSPPLPPPLLLLLLSTPSCHLHARRPCDQLLLRPTFSCNQRSLPHHRVKKMFRRRCRKHHKYLLLFGVFTTMHIPHRMRWIVTAQVGLENATGCF